MTASSPAARHLAELTAKKSRLYGLLTPVDGDASAADGGEGGQRDLAAIVEFAVWQELSPDADRVRSCRDALAAGIEPLSPAAWLAAWRRAVEAGLPSRKACVKNLETYADWLAALPPLARPAVADGFPWLAPFTADLGKHMKDVLHGIAALERAETVARLMQTLGSYRETDADIVLGATRVAVALLRDGSADELAAIENVITVDQMLESADACRLLPELGKLVQAAGEQGDELAVDAIAAVRGIAAENVSSAYATAAAWRRMLGKYAPDVAAACLRGGRRITAAAGNRSIGFCTRALPRLYARHGNEAMEAFVTAACEIATQQGVTACLWFLERRTAAAREMLT